MAQKSELLSYMGNKTLKGGGGTSCPHTVVVCQGKLTLKPLAVLSTGALLTYTKNEGRSILIGIGIDFRN